MTPDIFCKPLELCFFFAKAWTHSARHCWLLWTLSWLNIHDPLVTLQIGRQRSPNNCHCPVGQFWCACAFKKCGFITGSKQNSYCSISLFHLLLSTRFSTVHVQVISQTIYCTVLTRALVKWICDGQMTESTASLVHFAFRLHPPTLLMTHDETRL